VENPEGAGEHVKVAPRAAGSRRFDLVRDEHLALLPSRPGPV
jgi:hypothetical protein